MESQLLLSFFFPQSTSGTHVALCSAIMDTSNTELNDLMFKLHKLLDGDRRQVFTQPCYMRNLNQWLPLTLNVQSKLRVVKYFSA